MHTGDAWGAGCITAEDAAAIQQALEVEVIGTHGRLLSRQCSSVLLSGLGDKRQKAVEFARSTPALSNKVLLRLRGKPAVAVANPGKQCRCLMFSASRPPARMIASHRALMQKTPGQQVWIVAFIVHLCPRSAHTPHTTMSTHKTPRCLPSAPHATPGATRSAGGAAVCAAGGEAGGGSGPAMEKRNIFSLFRLWLNRQGGSAALQALVAQADTGSGGGMAQGGATGAGDGLLDIGEVQQLLMKVGIRMEWAREPLGAWWWLRLQRSAC